MPEKQPETAQTVEYLQGEKGVVRLMELAAKADELLALKRSLRLKRLLPKDDAEGRSHVMTEFEPKRLDGEGNPRKNGKTNRVLRRRFELVKKTGLTNAELKREERNIQTRVWRLQKKAKNLIREAHIRMTADIISRVKVLVWPKLQSKEMTERWNKEGKRRALNSKTARSMLSLCHSKARRKMKCDH